MTKSNFRKKGFTLAYGSRGRAFIMAGRQQEQEAERSHVIHTQEAKGDRTGGGRK